MQLTAAMLRALKGAPISVLMALALAGQPVTATWLEAITGYTDKTVRTALIVLTEFGLITRNGRSAWQIAAGAMQLPLMMPELDEPEPPGEAIDADAGEENDSGKIPETGALSESDSGKIPETSRQNAKVSGKIPETSPLASSGFNQNLESGNIQPLARAPDPEKFRVNLAALDEHEIREPARSRLAALAHVTPRLIRYHCAHTPNSGLAIYRIENNWAVPDDWIDPAELAAEPAAAVDQVDQVADLAPAPVEIAEQFEGAIDELAAGLSRADWVTWVKPLRLAGVSAGGELVARVANGYVGEWLEDHVKRRLEELLGRRLRIVVGP